MIDTARGLFIALALSLLLWSAIVCVFCWVLRT
jgi:hypothetical protein